MEGSDKLLVDEVNNIYNIPSVLYNDTGLYLCEASNMLGILSNSTPSSLIGEDDADLMYGALHIKNIFKSKLLYINHV